MAFFMLSRPVHNRKQGAKRMPDRTQRSMSQPPGKRRGAATTVILAIASVVALGAGAVGLFFLAKDDSETPDPVTSEPWQVATRFATLFEQARNEGADGVAKHEVRAVLCADEHDELDRDLRERQRKESTRTARPTSRNGVRIIVKDVRVSDDRGVATLLGDQGGRLVDQDFDLVKEATGWKVCGVYQSRR
jgi:hypothetical protein